MLYPYFLTKLCVKNWVVVFLDPPCVKEMCISGSDSYVLLFLLGYL